LTVHLRAWRSGEIIVDRDFETMRQVERCINYLKTQHGDAVSYVCKDMGAGQD